jgi:hypothetical protein
LRREAAVFTGEDGSIQPSPVPADPGGEKTLPRTVVVVVDDDDAMPRGGGHPMVIEGGAKEETSRTTTTTRRRMREPPRARSGEGDSFMMVMCVFDCGCAQFIGLCKWYY